MSRLAKKALLIPERVTVSLIGERVLEFKGPLGLIEQEFDSSVVFIELKSGLSVSRANDSKIARSMQGLYWILFRNHIQGVLHGFEKKLELQGVGYRWEIKGTVLSCLVGFSHPVDFIIPEGIKIEQPVSNSIVVRGYDKQKVGQVAANIRRIKPPEPYKGKGIRYFGEVIALREGKSAGKK